MVAGVYDIVCEQGATFVRNLEWLDENEIPIDMTGYTARMQVRPSYRSSEVLLSLTTENGNIVLAPSTGSLSLYLAAEQTDVLTPRRAVYDLEVVSPSLVVTRILQGAFTIVPQITR